MGKSISRFQLFPVIVTVDGEIFSQVFQPIPKTRSLRAPLGVPRPVNVKILGELGSKNASGSPKAK
jgi:hypothetical protein